MKKTKKQKPLMRPPKNCSVCNGLGIELFADSFDQDNGKPCWKCLARAEKRGCELILPYPR